MKVQPGTYEETYRLIVPEDDEKFVNTPLIIEGASSKKTTISGHKDSPKNNFILSEILIQLTYTR